MKLSAQQVFNKLMLEDKILEEEGQIKFHFANVDYCCPLKVKE